MTGTTLELTESRRSVLSGVVSTWLARRGHAAGTPASVTVREVELLRPGRPGLLDVLADVEDHLAHAVLAVLEPPGGPGPGGAGGGNGRRDADESVLGRFDDGRGPGLVVDPLYESDLAHLVLATVTGEPEEWPSTSPVIDEEGNVVVAFPDHCLLRVLTWLHDGPHPGVEMLVALDEAGFNHLAAPIAVWRRGGRDLGSVQELFPSEAGGQALCLTSLRDLFGAGCAPHEAGGDFAPEARALGHMTARLHLALARAFGVRARTVAEWAQSATADITREDPSLLESPRADGALAGLARLDVTLPVIRSHGDFHLGRTVRTDQGWVVSDCMPGGRVRGSAGPVFRSPLGDVADMMWSLHQVAAGAATDHENGGRSGAVGLAQAWRERNCRAYLRGYLGTQGIGDLVPTDPSVVWLITTVFELERAAARADNGREEGRP